MAIVLTKAQLSELLAQEGDAVVIDMPDPVQKLGTYANQESCAVCGLWKCNAPGYVCDKAECPKEVV